MSFNGGGGGSKYLVLILAAKHAADMSSPRKHWNLEKEDCQREWSKGTEEEGRINAGATEV